MRGSPITRATSSDGRWAYTLYDGAGGTPFLHALDTSKRQARCIDLPMLAGGQDLGQLRITMASAQEIAHCWYAWTEARSRRHERLPRKGARRGPSRDRLGRRGSTSFRSAASHRQVLSGVMFSDSNPTVDAEEFDPVGFAAECLFASCRQPQLEACEEPAVAERRRRGKRCAGLGSRRPFPARARTGLGRTRCRRGRERLRAVVPQRTRREACASRRRPLGAPVVPCPRARRPGQAAPRASAAARGRQTAVGHSHALPTRSVSSAPAAWTAAQASVAM